MLGLFVPPPTEAGWRDNFLTTCSMTGEGQRRPLILRIQVPNGEWQIDERQAEATLSHLEQYCAAPEDATLRVDHGHGSARRGLRPMHHQSLDLTVPLNRADVPVFVTLPKLRDAYDRLDVGIIRNTAHERVLGLPTYAERPLALLMAEHRSGR